MRFCKVALRKIRPVAVGDKFCRKKTAEVLTEKGWIQLQYLDITNTKVATMDPTTHELSYVYATNKHEFDYNSKVDGKMYYLKSQQIYIECTPNHKNYVKPRPVGRALVPQQFQMMTATECFGKRLKHKRDCINSYTEYTTIDIPDDNNLVYTYPINAYLKLLGMFISDGNVSQTAIHLSMQKQRKRNYINSLEQALGFNFNYSNSKQLSISKTVCPGIYEEFKDLSIGALNKRLPNYIWNMGVNNCRALLDGLINGDWSHNKQGSISYYTSSPGLADDVQRLALHCGWSATVKKLRDAGYSSIIRATGQVVTANADTLSVRIVKTKNEPQVNHEHIHEQKIQEEKWIDYKGKVMCIEVPDTHLFYCREDKLSPPGWTGNSSRSGQKGIAALLMREADMLTSVDGIRPALVFNPHGLPSRMTVSQLIESLIGNVCAIRGVHHDATMFKKVDIESIAEELEQHGLHRYGYERMISGLTGEYVDTLVFFGPTFYQRLQKFVADAEYSVRHALTDAITFQPLDQSRSKCCLIAVLVYIW